MLPLHMRSVEASSWSSYNSWFDLLHLLGGRVLWTTSQTQCANTKILSPSRALLPIYAGSKSGTILKVKSPICLCSNTRLKCAGLVKGCASQQQILFVQNPIIVSRKEFCVCGIFCLEKLSLVIFSVTRVQSVVVREGEGLEYKM